MQKTVTASIRVRRLNRNLGICNCFNMLFILTMIHCDSYGRNIFLRANHRHERKPNLYEI